MTDAERMLLELASDNEESWQALQRFARRNAIEPLAKVAAARLDAIRQEQIKLRQVAFEARELKHERSVGTAWQWFGLSKAVFRPFNLDEPMHLVPMPAWAGQWRRGGFIHSSAYRESHRNNTAFDEGVALCGVPVRIMTRRQTNLPCVGCVVRFEDAVLDPGKRQSRKAKQQAYALRTMLEIARKEAAERGAI